MNEEKQRDALMWGIFCLVTRRSSHNRGDADDMCEFEKWLSDNAGRREFTMSFKMNDAVSPSPQKKADLALLGLKAGASTTDIDQAWLRVRGKLHPDRGGNHSQFIAAKSAFERLKTDAARQ